MALGDDGEGYDRDGDTSPVEMEAPLGDFSSTRMGINPKSMNDVIYSDIGINILLSRLKQSVVSARDFSVFLKKRSSLEEDHAQGLKKLSKSTFDAARRHDARQGSYSLQLGDISRAHERMADHGIQFALSLHQMHEDLNELSNNMDRGRKHWKAEGMNSEKKVKDAEIAMEKAKARVESLAEDYDRARTGDKSSGRVFTVKGPKSAEKHEEDLLRKLQAADSDYASKVQSAQSQRQENVMTLRPQAVKAIQELIKECDSALTLQLQKFAAFNEKLLVGNGVIVSPIKDASTDGVGESLSLREMVQQIDNERDFQTYVTSHTNNVPPKPADIQYEKNPILLPPPAAPPMKQATSAADRLTGDRQPETPQAPRHQPKASVTAVQPASAQNSSPITPSSTFGYQQGRQQPTPDRSFRGPPSGQLPTQAIPPETDRNYRGPPTQQTQAQPAPTPISSGQLLPSGHNSAAPRQPQASQPFQGSSAPPPPQQKNTAQLQSNNPTTSHFQSNNLPTSQYQSSSQQQAQNQSNYPSTSQHPQSTTTNGSTNTRGQSSQMPNKPMFGVSLDQLFRRDETAVPIVVYQCIQAVDLFGLDVEGIYRLSGNSAHIQQLKGLFDQDPTRIDFRNPENFHHDVNSVAGLLKQFLRDLPDPLMTTEFYNEFIEAARVEDDIQRRDSLHAVINSLPDPNYATLRALILHLNRVQEHSQSNRMSTSNLAICFAPTIMGPHRGPNMADAGLQARVIDTILQNTYQIFDED